MSQDPAKITVRLPHGCDRRALRIDALDSTTRELAYGTTIEVEGKLLYCQSFKEREIANGIKLLVLEVGPECYEFTNKEKN
jgi:hypothetical protein